MTKLVSVLTGTIFFLAGTSSFAQDLIKFKNGEAVNAKVIEVDEEKVKYKKYDNLDGPSYTARKSQISVITYENGTEDVFDKSTPASAAVSKKSEISKSQPPNDDTPKDESDEDMFKRLTQKGKKVFVETVDKGYQAHFTKALNRFGRWQIVTDKDEADFILRFSTTNMGVADQQGRAFFINPKNNHVFMETEKVNSIMTMEINPKRAIANKIVSKRIEPLF